MSNRAKISPAFEPLLEDSGLNDKREAIGLYRAPEQDSPRLRSRLRWGYGMIRPVEALHALN